MIVSSVSDDYGQQGCGSFCGNSTICKSSKPLKYYSKNA